MSEYCCRWMRLDLEHACDQHASRLDCPDCLVHRASDGSFGLIIHDGGGSFVSIYACPWCGTELHDGSVEASLCGGSGRDDVVGDLGLFLGAASEEELRAASEAQWTGPEALGLFAVAARQNAMIAAELSVVLTALEQAEAAGGHLDESVDWFIDPIAADRWIRRHRPLLHVGPPEPVASPGRPGRRIDLF